MYNLTAKNETIEQVFQHRAYLIPDYQRRYTWDKTQCQRLMDDLFDVYDGHSEHHFLGCLVIAKNNEGIPRWEVIDGQQRLTTLSLVIKALFNIGALGLQTKRENPILARMLKTEDDEGNLAELRLKSEVWDRDKQNYEEVLLDKTITAPGNAFHSNYQSIYGELKEKLAISAGGDGLGKFIKMLRNSVFLMPIECESLDSALNIFQTLNDRGMPLGDSDIFKARMYKHTDAERRKQFVTDWNELVECEKIIKNFVERLFRIRMHILRAEAGETGKERELRTFFRESGELENPDKLVRNLKKYRAIFFDDWGADAPDINIWWCILDTMPNLYWQYPLFVFLHKYAPEYDASQNEPFSLPKEKTQEFIALMKDTARYLFIKGVATNSVNTIKDYIFRVCSAIAHGEDYAAIYRNNADGNLDIFRQKLKIGDYGRYQKGLVLTNSALLCASPEEAEGYSKLLMTEKPHIEHILPKKWSHYDGWDSETHAECIGKLGNLIPFERRLNIRASNEFFARKQREYAMSESAEVRGLRKIPKWMPEELNNRHNEVIARLLEFFQY